MKIYFAILCSIFWLEHSFLSLGLTTTDEASPNISIANVNTSLENSTSKVTASGDVPLQYEITGTLTKSSNAKDIHRELLEEIRKDTEQRKNGTTNGSRERKITKTDNKQLSGAKVNNETIAHPSIAASSNNSTATVVTSTTSTKPNVQQAHKLVAEGVEMADTQAGNLTTKLTSMNGQAGVSGAKSTTKPTTRLFNVNASQNSTQSSISTTTNSTILATSKPTTTTTLGTTSTTMTTTTTTTARTITTTKAVMGTTITANPTKPKITYSMDPKWEDGLLIEQANNNQPDIRLITNSTTSLSASSASKTASTASTIVNQPSQYEPPHAQPSREHISNAWSAGPSNDYIVPIFTVLVTVPLAIGVAMVMYRRLRECWSTRHYHRMDFLVDGMYND